MHPILTQEEFEELNSLREKLWNIILTQRREPNPEELRRFNHLHKKYMHVLNTQVKNYYIDLILKNSSFFDREHLGKLTIRVLKDMWKKVEVNKRLQTK